MDSSFALRRAPLLTPVIAFAVGLAARAHLATWVLETSLWLLVAAIVVALPLASHVPRSLRAVPLLVALPLLLGMLAGSTDDPQVIRLDAGPAVIAGTVEGSPRPVRSRVRPRHSGSSAADFDIRARLRDAVINGVPRRGRLSVLVPATTGLARGDRIRVTAMAREGRRALVVAHGGLIEFVERATPGLATFDRWRHSLRRQWLERFDAAGPWLTALFLGDRELLPERTAPRFRRIGQSHLIAISGLHVGILVTLLAAAARRLAANPLVVRIALPVTLVAYGALAGGDAPVVRAVILGVLGSLAVSRGRHLGLSNGLALALLLLGSWRGDEATRASFVLSFSAVAGIALLGARPPHEPLPRRVAAGWRRRLATALRISGAAWLGASIPLVWWTPDFVPWGPLFALLLLPFLTAMLVIAVLALAPPLGDVVLVPAANGVVAIMDLLSLLLDRLPATPWTWPPLPPPAVALGLASVAARILERRCESRGRRHGWSLLLAGLSVVASLGASRPDGAELLSLGRGQAFLVAGRSATLLYDAGSVDRREQGAVAIRDAMRAHGRSHIDAVILSHPHADHVLAIPPLLERARIDVAVIGPRFDETDLGEAITRLLRRAGTRIVVAARGDRIRVGEFELEVLHPRRSAPPLADYGLNDDSLVVTLRGEGLEICLTGDLERAGLATCPAPARPDLLLLPHHGRFAVGLRWWLQETEPRRLLASSGRPLSLRARNATRGWAVTETGRDGTIWLPAASGWQPRPSPWRR